MAGPAFKALILVDLKNLYYLVIEPVELFTAWLGIQPQNRSTYLIMLEKKFLH